MKKISTDNGNILNLNLNNSSILFKIVHFECEVFFFFIRIWLNFLHEFAKYLSMRILCHFRSSLCLILKNACHYIFVAMVT